MAGIRVDERLVRKVSDLANLYLTEDEAVFYQGRLARILEYVEQLDSVDSSTGGDEVAERRDSPSSEKSSVETSDPERADEVTPSLPVDDAVGQAPARSGTAFQVPRIIE